MSTTTPSLKPDALMIATDRLELEYKDWLTYLLSLNLPLIQRKLRKLIGECLKLYIKEQLTSQLSSQDLVERTKHTRDLRLLMEVSNSICGDWTEVSFGWTGQTRTLTFLPMDFETLYFL